MNEKIIDGWENIARKCEICGKPLFPNALYAYKIRAGSKYKYACGYTHFRQMQNEYEASAVKGHRSQATKVARTVFELNGAGEVIRTFCSLKAAALSTNRSYSFLCTQLRSNIHATIDGRRFIYEADYRKENANV